MNIVEEFILKWTNHPSEVFAMRRDISDIIAVAVAAERAEIAKTLQLTIKTAIETEREACAHLVEKYPLWVENADEHSQENRDSSIAAAIRARSGTEIQARPEYTEDPGNETEKEYYLRGKR